MSKNVTTHRIERGKRSCIIVCDNCTRAVPHSLYIFHLIKNEASKKNCPYCLEDSLKFKDYHGLPGDFELDRPRDNGPSCPECGITPQAVEDVESARGVDRGQAQGYRCINCGEEFTALRRRFYDEVGEQIREVD